jgi:hypothetical protein
MQLRKSITLASFAIAAAFATPAGAASVAQRGEAEIQRPNDELNAIAGPDRVVIQGGKTYLNGWAGYGDGPEGRRGRGRRGRRGEAQEQQAARPEFTVRWIKDSGPGEVAFENAGAGVTSASFSALGEYVLKLTADNGSANAESTLRVVVDEAPPAQRLDPVSIETFKLDSPLWNHRAKALVVNWLPHVIDRLDDPELREGGINNIIDAGSKLAGREHQGHRGYVFSNSWVFNTIEAMCVALRLDPRGDAETIAAQAKMRATIDKWIPLILAAQESDGYFQTAFTLNDRSPGERWSPRRRADHEGYVAGYFLEAGIAHYELTEGADRRLFDAARKLADCWHDNIGPAPKKTWFDGHQAMELALVRFGRFVNDIEGGGSGDKYIELAKFLLDSRRNGSSYDQSHLPVIHQYEALGHAVRAVYSYTGMADVAMETGDVDYHSAVASIWDNIVNRKYYITGGVGSGETSEGFGPDFSLRNNSYCESCSSAGEIFFQHRLNLMHHDARFADLYEETLYNAMLGSVDLGATNFYYTNPLDSRGDRYAWHNCPCCVGNIPRTLLSLPTWAYLKDDAGLYVNLFVGGETRISNVAGVDVEMIQKTDYPWSGDAAIEVDPSQARRFSIRVRVPNRDASELYSAEPNADGVESIAVNGEAQTPEIVKGYAVLTREWRPGDRIEIKLPMRPQIVRADERIEAARGKVALRYGPVVYSVESVDQNINQAIDLTAPLATEWRPDLLGGVMTLKGRWADGTPLLAIPNYARNNRGRGDAPVEEGGRGRGQRALTSKVWIDAR